MRALCLLLAEDASPPTEQKISLFNLADQVTVHSLPLTKWLWCYAEMELLPAEWDVVHPVRWVLIGPDGDEQRFDVSGIPPTIPEHEIATVWRLRHQIEFAFIRPGPHELRLYVGQELVAHRELLLRTQTT